MFYSRRTKRVILGFLALGLLVCFIILGSLRFAASTREQKLYEEERAAMKQPEPNVFTVETGTRPQIRRYAAQLKPWMEANVPAEVAGRVTNVMIEAGQSVKEDEPLVQLDDRLASIAVSRSKANYEEARRLLAESERLLKTRAISDSQYRAQNALVRIAEAEFAESAETLARHTIRAPFNGIVNARLVDIGDAINANQPVAEIVDLEKLRIELFVSENDLGAFPENKEIDLLLPSRPGRIFEPRVDFVSRSADPATRMFRVEALLPNTEDPLPGGLQGIVSTEVDRFKGLPMVPAMAVRFIGKNSMVWKQLPDGTAEQVAIVVGPELDGVYPVLDGLDAGDRIIIR
jgi:membrane fusion protein (multidrug efflux system)